MTDFAMRSPAYLPFVLVDIRRYLRFYLSMPNDTEVTALWITFKKSDKEAYGSLVRIFYKILFNYGTKLSRNVNLVEDCIQDLFLEMWQRREYLSDTEHEKFYLLKALRRKIYFEQTSQQKWQYEPLKKAKRNFDVYNGSEFAQLKWEADRSVNCGILRANELAAIAKGRSLDWTQEIFKNTSIHNHNLSFAAGSEKTKLYYALNQFFQGIQMVTERFPSKLRS